MKWTLHNDILETVQEIRRLQQEWNPFADFVERAIRDTMKGEDPNAKHVRTES